MQLLEPRAQGGYVAVVGLGGSGAGGLAVRVSGDFVDSDHYSQTDGFLLGSAARTKAILRLDPSGNVLSRIEIEADRGILARGLVQLRDGSVVLAGTTNSPQYKVARELFPEISIPETGEVLSETWGFVLKTDSALQKIEISSLIGGQARGTGEGTRILNIARDAQGNVYLGGSTTHRDFPVTDRAWRRVPNLREADGESGRTLSEGFLMKLSPDLGSLLASTFLAAETPNCLPPGPGPCQSRGVANAVVGLSVQRRGNPAILLATTGNDFPVTVGAYQPPADDDASRRGIGQRLYLATFSSDLARLMASSHISTMDRAIPFASSGVGLLASPDGNLLTLHSEMRLPSIETEVFQKADILSLWNPEGAVLLDHLRFESRGDDAASASVLDVGIGPDGTVWVTGIANRVRLGIAGLDPVIDVPTLWNNFLLKLRGPGLTPERVDRLPAGTAIGLASVSVAGVNVVYQGGRVSQYPAEGISSPTILGIADMATPPSAVLSGMAPMQLVRLMGTGFGPAHDVHGSFDHNGFLSTMLEGLRVAVNGRAAPLLGVGPNFIDFIVPAATAEALADGSGKAIVKLTSAGGLDLEYAEKVAPFWLRPFGLSVDDESGFSSFAGTALNEDGTVNSPSSPALPGEVLTVYLNGAGLPSRIIPDGKRMDEALSWFETQPLLTATQPLSEVEPVQRAAGEPLYFGAAPGLVAGTIQMNFRIPEEALEKSEFLVRNPVPVTVWVHLPVTAETGEAAFQSAANLLIWMRHCANEVDPACNVQ